MPYSRLCTHRCSLHATQRSDNVSVAAVLARRYASMRVPGQFKRVINVSVFITALLYMIMGALCYTWYV